MKKINLALIGCGKWGSNHFKDLSKREDVNLLWICSLPESIESLKKKFKVDVSIRSTNNFDDIINDTKVDAVIIATTPKAHYKIALESLNKGKHVLLEKPMTLSFKESDELLILAKKKKKTLMVGHIHYYNPYLKKLGKDIKDGSFGEIKWVSSLYGSDLKRKDVSIEWDVLPHDFSLFNIVLGGFPTKVSVSGNDDILNMNLVFSDGKNEMFCCTTVSWDSPIKRRELIVSGTKMKAYFNDYGDCKLTYFNKVGPNEGRIEKRFRKLKGKQETPLGNEIDHFLDCIRTKKKPITDGKNGAIITYLIEKLVKNKEYNIEQEISKKDLMSYVG